jgi:hypothetical protein
MVAVYRSAGEADQAYCLAGDGDEVWSALPFADRAHAAQADDQLGQTTNCALVQARANNVVLHLDFNDGVCLRSEVDPVLRAFVERVAKQSAFRWQPAWLF